ncbi:MAG TPA: ABC-F family ATP-binding cassette domain-containing protein [Rhizomicrobium sp.]|jgi:ATP-binding cassette subfamily F protein 3|nr:ABC-F family ATP-binding cassette domain-containing protein [Rhizomicrobium sp.]
MLVIDNIIVRIAGREILDGASATLPAGRRIGLVGRNGAGKSTLLKVILGQMSTDQGEVTWPKDWRIGAVAQEAPSGPITLIETVLAADKERTELLARAEHESDPHRLGDIHARLEAIDAYSAPARGAAILAGLGFPAEDQIRPCSEFSGGWRMRVALAAILFSAPDLLLLDEPTNYLDLEGVLWLEDYLKRYRGSVIVVSHDRDLLNNVTEFILHLEYQKLTLYSGNYDTFVATRAMRRANDVAFAKKQDAARKHMQAFVDRFKAKASKARQAQSRMKMLERLQQVEVPPDEYIAPIRLPKPLDASPPLITLDKAAVGYDGRAILSNISLRFDPDDRIALLGKNGNGKSTLAKLLCGKLEAMGGEIVRSRKLSPGYFAQHQLDELDGTATPVQTLARYRPKMTETELRTRLGSMGLTGDKALTRVGSLSGGERARLMLTLATLDRPNLLILDEPTNHLDIDAREELLMALNDFEGAVILVSHDRRLIEATMDRLLLVADGRVEPFDGDLDDYRRFLLSGESVPSAAREEPAPKITKEEARREAAERRKVLKPLKEKVELAEYQIAELNKEIAKYDKTLADPLLFSRDRAKAAAVSKKRAEAQRKLEAAEARWLAVNEDYESAIGADA